MLVHARRIIRRLIFSAVVIAVGHSVPTSAQTPPAAASKLTEPQLEQLVAPIALHPDPLLSQMLMASTYPLEVVEAARWVKQHPEAGKDAVSKERWDESVKSLVAFPQVLEMMNEKLGWTQQLGDAFLQQQEDVLSAVQRLRAKADAQGTLTTTQEQTVEKQVVPAPSGNGGGVAINAPATTYVIQPADPQTIYIPSYDPTVVYGSWPYPDYPPYSWYPPAWVPGRGLWFAAGIATGGALWGWCDWRNRNVSIDIDRYNRFNRSNQISRNQGNFAKWEHNAVHRRGASYRNADVAARYGRDRRDAASREQFRGRAEMGRRDLMAGGPPGNASNLTPGNRTDRANRVDGGRGAANAGDRRPQAKDQAKRNTGKRQAITPKGNVRQPGNRGQAAVRARPMPPRTASGPGRPAAFHGMGNGPQVRQFSSRGSYSRGGGGGGFRGGGGRGGGGRR